MKSARRLRQFDRSAVAVGKDANRDAAAALTTLTAIGVAAIADVSVLGFALDDLAWSGNPIERLTLNAFAVVGFAGVPMPSTSSGLTLGELVTVPAPDPLEPF